MRSWRVVGTSLFNAHQVPRIHATSYLILTTTCEGGIVFNSFFFQMRKSSSERLYLQSFITEPVSGTAAELESRVILISCSSHYLTLRAWNDRTRIWSVWKDAVLLPSKGQQPLGKTPDPCRSVCAAMFLGCLFTQLEVIPMDAWVSPYSEEPELACKFRQG